MGMGRNSSRLASRRLATIGSKAGMHNDGDPDDNEAPGDEDWCEPGPAAGSLLLTSVSFFSIARLLCFHDGLVPGVHV